MNVVNKSQRPPVLVVLIGALAVIVAAMAIGTLMDADSGSYADWLAALATLAAFGAAVIAGWYAHRALMVEHARDERRDQDDRDRERRDLRAQAEKVAAWATHPSAAKSNGQYERPTVEILVRNTTDLPITDAVMRLTARVGPHDALSRQGAFVPLGSITHILVPPSDLPLSFSLKPGLADVVRDLMNSNTNEHISVQVEMTFTDAGGRVWVRRQDGTLFGGDAPAHA